MIRKQRGGLHYILHLQENSMRLNLEGNQDLSGIDFNSLTAIGPYMAHRFSWALFKLNNFSNFCPFAMFDSSECS